MDPSSASTSNNALSSRRAASSSVLTRSMLRKSLDNPSTVTRTALSPRPVNRVGTATDRLVTKAGRAVIASSSQHTALPAPRRKSMTTSSQTVRSNAIKAGFGKTTAQVAGMTGMGVRTGPPVLGQRSPTKANVPKENDPFSLAFKPVLPSLTPTKVDQAKHNAFTSPTKGASSPNKTSPLSFGLSPSRTLHFDSPTKATAGRLPSSPGVSPASSRKHLPNSSDDESDSPRKRQRQNGFGFVPSRSPLPSISQQLGSNLRSPPAKKRGPPSPSFASDRVYAGPVVFGSSCQERAPGTLSNATSVPMTRTRHQYANFDSTMIRQSPPTAHSQILAPPTIVEELVPDEPSPPQEATTLMDEDVSMTDSGSGDVSMTSNTTLSEDASKRLTDLQAMLNRLAKPRHSLATTHPVLAARESTSTPPASRRLSQTAPTRPAGSSVLNTTVRPRASMPAAGRRPLAAPTLASASKARPTIRRSELPPPPTSRPETSLMPPPMSRPLRRQSTLAVPSAVPAQTVPVVQVEKAVVKPKSLCLRGVVAFVDVRTQEGDDAGMLFVDMLKSLGARVVTRPTLTLTHIIFKAGRPGTLQHYRNHPEPKPHIVGIAWVVRCAELEQRASEKPYRVEVAHEPALPKPRRRSMEPKAYGQSDLNRSIGEADPSMHAAISASIERARRKSLQYAPKIASPLRKKVWSAPLEEEEDLNALGDEEMMT